MLQAIIDELKVQFVERGNEIEAIVRAVLARQHVVMLGAAGIGKSALTREFCSRIIGAKYFQRMLRRDSTTDEVFGPVSLKGLESDQHRRNITAKLPEADIANMEEVFKCNSTLLNGLLDIINERTFENDSVTVRCPLSTMVASSNEMPQSEDLSAFWDRFIVRLQVQDIREDTAFLSFLEAKSGRGPVVGRSTVTIADLHKAQAEVNMVAVPTEVNQQLAKLRRELHKEGIKPSPRRFSGCLDYLKATAWLDGRTKVEVDDLPVLTDCLWENPDQLPKVAQILSTLASPELGRVVELFDAAKEAFDKVSDGSDAHVMLETNTKLKRAYAELEKLANTTGGKTKSKAQNAMKTIKEWNQQILQKIGITTL